MREPRSCLIVLLLTAIVLIGLTGCAPGTKRPGGEATLVDPDNPVAVSAMLDRLAERRVVHVGEIHDRLDHHDNQLLIIRGLHERGVRLAIGVEWFQEPFQRHLDDFLAGRIDEREMLRRTGYYERWTFNYRLYRDILAFAKAQGIPVIALNAPGELVDAVSRNGIAGLSPAERALLPASIAPADPNYEKRLRTAFELHGGLPEERFQRFMEVQSVWDEFMASRAARFLTEHPDHSLVILAGSAHVLHDSAIPARLRRQVRTSQAVVVTKPFDPLPGVAPDFIFVARDLALERPGRTGMSLRGEPDGVLVHEVKAGGAAERAGLRAGDRVLSIGDQPVTTLSDARLALMDGTPGQRLRVVIQRGGSGRALTRTLTLL
jgi:uncharacterized iron-regulated protein